MREAPRVHVVRRGETLASIARRYETTASELLRLNPGVVPEAMPVGLKITLPAGKPLIRNLQPAPGSPR